MRIFLLFFICFSCFSMPEGDEGLGVWSNVKSSMSRLVGWLSPHAEKTDVGDVRDTVNNVKNRGALSMVREYVQSWWREADFSDKATCALMGVTFVGGTVLIGATFPAWYAGTCGLLPNCFFASPGCTFPEFALYACKFYVVGATLTFSGMWVLIEGVYAAANIVQYSAQYSKDLVVSTVQGGVRMAKNMLGAVSDTVVWGMYKPHSE